MNPAELHNRPDCVIKAIIDCSVAKVTKEAFVKLLKNQLTVTLPRFIVVYTMVICKQMLSSTYEITNGIDFD